MKNIMFQLVGKKILPLPWSPAFNLPQRNQNLCFLQLHHFSATSESLIPKSSQSNEDSDRRLFIINYLTKTCGLPQKSAESSSKYLTFKTRQKPDSVISFFKNQGFTSNQISLLLKKNPKILTSSNPDKNLLPKFDFFRSLGLSTKDIAVLITGVNSVLVRSLEKQIIPVFRYISTLLQCHDKTLVCIKRFPPILGSDIEDILKPNVECLGEVGVPSENVMTLVRIYPRAITFKHDRFKKAVDAVKSMGFDPLRIYFTTAVFAYARNSDESMWKKKVELFKCYGFSDADVYKAFQRYPFCMTSSSEKIQKVMDYIVHRMGFEPSLVVKCPNLVSCSMEKRIVPRCTVYQALLAKGLVPNKFSLKLLFQSPETKFLSTFVEPFETQVPGLMMMYKNSGPIST